MKVNLLRAVMLAVISCVGVISVAQAATAVFDVSDSLTGTQLQSKTYEFFVPVAGAYEGTLTA